MNRRFTKIFAVIMLIAAGMTACGQKKNVTIDDTFETETANIQEIAVQEITTQEATTEKELEDDEYVLVKKYIPDIYVELMYATDNNFTGVRIYDFTDAYLRYGTVKKLANVQKELKEQGAERLNATAKELYGIDNFCDMIADETIAEDPETLLAYLEEKGHPALTMEPMM